MFRPLEFAALVLSVLTPSRAQATSCKPHDAEHREVTVDDYQREYWLYVPCSAHPRADLVIMLHGWGGSGDDVAHHFGWALQAEKYGLVVAFPTALPIRADYPEGILLPAGAIPGSTWHPHNTRGWWTSDQLHVEGITHHPDDEQFLLELRGILATQGVTNNRPMFVAGFSNGAALAKHLALTHPDAIRAVVAAGHAGDRFPDRLKRPVPLLLIIGTADDTGQVSEANWSNMRAVERTYWWGSASGRPTIDSDSKQWSLLDGCHHSAEATEMRWGKRVIWNHCARRSKVELVTVNDLGHEWLGASNSRWAETHPAGASLNFAAMAAKFFQQHR